MIYSREWSFEMARFLFEKFDPRQQFISTLNLFFFGHSMVLWAFVFFKLQNDVTSTSIFDRIFYLNILIRIILSLQRAKLR